MKTAIIRFGSSGQLDRDAQVTIDGYPVTLVGHRSLKAALDEAGWRIVNWDLRTHTANGFEVSVISR